MPKEKARIRPRFRIYKGAEIALGPGKAELLDSVHETGSIGRAARRMKMSYMRAWQLIQTINRCFRRPLVAAARGGRQKGGVHLTPTGIKILQLYRQMEKEGMKATRRYGKKIVDQLR